MDVLAKRKILALAGNKTWFCSFIASRYTKLLKSKKENISMYWFFAN
jgi:hypothetical protein